MRKSFRPRSRYVISFVTIVALLLFVQWMPAGFIGRGAVEAQTTEETAAFDMAHPMIQAVMAVQNRHSERLMAIPDVIGHATGLDEAGLPAVHVFLKKKVGAGVIPERLEGVPVVAKVTGEIFAMTCPPGGDPNTNTVSIYTPPVPIGVSTGNSGSCSAGTIGARVKDKKGNVYALSNNHVFALQNSAPKGSQILQPGLFDTACGPTDNNVIGSLSRFKKIKFKTNATNQVDAAIALTSVAALCNSTPANGYGIPSSTVVPASIDQGVQKYGRTTSLRHGTVIAINLTVTVSYNSGDARFVNQILVNSLTPPFIQPGDSGSLLVTDDLNANPVGLLFAGNEDGSLAIANPIDAVLAAFKVTIDGR